MGWASPPETWAARRTASTEPRSAVPASYTPVSCTTVHGGSRSSAAAMWMVDRPQARPSTSPSLTSSPSRSAATSPRFSGSGVVLGLGRGLDDDRVPQAVAGAQRVGALRVQLGGHADLDPYEIPLERGLQDPGHLEAADAELLGDLDLGLALEVEAAGHGRRLHQLSGSHPHG